MQIKGSSRSWKEIDAQALAVPVFKGETADKGLLKELDRAVGGLISSIIKAEEFKAKEAETAYFYLTSGSLKAKTGLWRPGARSKVSGRHRAL